MRGIDQDSFKHRTLEYSAAVENLFQSGSQWTSTKANIEKQLEALGQMLPAELVIARKVIAASDIETIRLTLREALQKGCHPGVRSCYHPQISKSPWVMNLRSEEDIDNFLDNTYPHWFKNGSLTEVVVMFNPPDLGLEKHQPEHFVFRLGVLIDRVNIEAQLGTSQLRDLDDIKRQDLIHINITANTVNFGDLNLRIGENYTLRNEPVDLTLTLQQFLYQPAILNQFMDSHHCELLIDLVDKVLISLKDDHLHLQEPLEAFGDHGMEFSEWQGRRDADDHVKWIKIYGFRGSGDDNGWRITR